MKSKNYEYNIYRHVITRELSNLMRKYPTIARTSFLTSPG